MLCHALLDVLILMLGPDFAREEAAQAYQVVPYLYSSSEHLSLGLQLNDAPLAIVDKRRSSHNVSEVMNLIGDVKDKVAVLVDDMIDTAGTITNAAKVDKQPALLSSDPIDTTRRIRLCTRLTPFRHNFAVITQASDVQCTSLKGSHDAFACMLPVGIISYPQRQMTCPVYI